MFSVGVDIVELSRFKNMNHPDRVAEFFLTDIELQESKTSADKIQFLASRFAVKEAVIKAVPEKLEFNEFAVVKNGNKPQIKFINNKYQKYQIAISLSHSVTSAIGF